MVLEEKFREDEALGMMFPTAMGVLQSMYPWKEIITTNCNTQVLKTLLAWFAKSEIRESVFPLSADLSAAYRRVKIRREDWRLLTCRSDRSSKVIWVNKVGTFGISSAPIWWSRLFSLVGRLVMRVMGQEKFCRTVYVDDLHAAFLGDRKFINLWVLVALYEALGTPFSYRKFSGGIVAQFVGYNIDYRMVALGITEKRGAWLLESWQISRMTGSLFT